MKYIFIRFILLILGVVLLYYISDFIQNSAVVEDGGYNLEGIIWFFRLVLGYIVISIGVFAYEAHLFNKLNKINQRNASLILIGIIVLFMIIFGKYFLEFVV